MNGSLKSSDVVAAWHLSKSSIITTGFWAIRLQINQVVDSDLEQLKSSWINYSRSHLFSLEKGRGPYLAPLVYQFLRSLY